jgi:hypothetical protein
VIESVTSVDLLLKAFLMAISFLLASMAFLMAISFLLASMAFLMSTSCLLALQVFLMLISFPVTSTFHAYFLFSSS